MNTVSCQYCKDLNSINDAIKTNNFNWYGITADNIISITYDMNHGCYVVFWRCDED
jgi:hypothetical protein